MRGQTGLGANLSSIEFESTAPEPMPATVGDSEAACRLRREAAAIAPAGLRSVIVSGPRGSGKRFLATWLHRNGPRRNRPLSWLELDEPTAPVPDRAALGGGTLVVCSVDSASPSMIARLVELASARATEPGLGLVLLTRASAEELRGRSLGFEQLLGRCSAARLQLPPLAERAEDIPALAHRLAVRSATRHDRSFRGFSARALSALRSRRFEGNLHELAAVVELAVLRSNADWLGTSDLGERAEAPVPAAGASLLVQLPGSSLRDIEGRAVALALQVADGRIVRAADLLGITRHAFRRKMDKHGLESGRAPRAEAVALDPEACI